MPEQTKEELSPKEKKIEELKNEIKRLRTEGKFAQFYTSIRKTSREIFKNDKLSDEQKKVKLSEACKLMVAEIENSFKA